MLLPSDIARLILGYLQEEGLSATSQTFIQECPNLKEYADHATGDGTIPACVFSLFGKGLTTILNEYVATKTKETQYEIPAMMTSLWKKLDFTLNQIKSMQNSPAISAYQRTRTRVGLANIARQRALTVASTGGAVVCSTVSETSSIISPAHVTSSLISHSTPVSFTAPLSRLNPASETHLQIQDGARLLNTQKDSSVHIMVSEQRINPGPMSPGRRKWDTPRKRGAAVAVSVGPGRTATMANSTDTEQPQPEEVIDENFPQLVIQNARDKILGDRTLQEKLAENINKILANEPVPIPSKAPAAVEQDQSIDEILGLQGEIHMSDDAIHDILEQTESDPAFQALFDLFECNKSKITDGGQENGDTSSSPEESEAAAPASTVEPLINNDQDVTQTDSFVQNTSATTAKTNIGHESKAGRKSTSTTLFKKTFLSSSSRASRVESCSARLLVTPSGSSATGSSSRKCRPASLNSSAVLTPMDTDEPLNTPPLPSDDMDTSASASEGCTSTAAFTGSAMEGRTQGSTTQSVPESHQQATVNNPTLSPHQGDTAANSGDGHSPQTGPGLLASQSGCSTSSSVTVSAASITPVTSVTVTTDSLTCAASSASHNSPTPPSAPLDTTPHTPSFSLPSVPAKAATDSGNVVSLKIIISDNQEDNSTDLALNQAISSISGDKIPTIYLSSPAKSPAPILCPDTPKSNMDEVAQAVSGLQNSEIFSSPITGKACPLLTSPLTGTSQTQQSYILQLPMNSNNNTFQGVGTAPSYFLVTDSPSKDARNRQVLLPAGPPPRQTLPINQFQGTAQSVRPGFTNASRLILPSPVKPVVFPVSVMGQTALGNVQMMPNRLVAIPSPVSLQQTETITASTVAADHSTTAGAEKALAGKVTPPLLAEKSCQRNTSKRLNHRRILCFDPSAEGHPQAANTVPTTNQTATPSVTNASPLPSIQQQGKAKSVAGPRTKPAILTGNKPKRRVQITRCPENPQPTAVFMKEVKKPMAPQPQQKDFVKKKPRKQHHTIYNQEPQNTTNNTTHNSMSENTKTLETEKTSTMVDKNLDVGEGRPTTSDSLVSATMTSDSSKKGTKDDKGESNRKEAAVKPREGRTEKKTQEMPCVTANKENEIKDSVQEQQQQSIPTPLSPRDFSPSATSQLASPQSKGSKAQSKTSYLAKQAAEMLQDIQGLNSPSTPGKRPGAGTLESCLPRTPCTGHNQGQISDSPRTPSIQSKSKDRDGTPKRLMPPNTPDVPTCSPASEAGSESSINMAAHTLMILSRAAIARTGTPLKDSLRQEAAAENLPMSLKNAKKRKQSSVTDSPPAKKESKRSPSRKKDRERKKLVDCFPHDLDVDKFLSSLHYDE